jgi:HEAT repeat protein
VRALALGALGSVGDASDGAAIEAAMTTGGPVEKRAAVHAASRVLGAAAVPALIEAKKDVRLTLDVVEALKRIGAKECLPPLQDVADNFYNPKIKERAAKAIKSLRRKLRR